MSVEEMQDFLIEKGIEFEITQIETLTEFSNILADKILDDWITSLNVIEF